jgi:hypothetical protein
MAYVFKVGLIVAGIWVWRRDLSGAAVEDDEPAEGKRAWIPLMVCGALVVGVVAFVITNAVKEKRIEKKFSASTPAAWAGMPAKLWPDLVLLQRAKFAHHSAMEAGCACLVRLPTGEIVALTAGHLLGKAGGVTPGFMRGALGGLDQKKLATLKTEITSWELFLPHDEDASAKVTGLYGEAFNFDEHCDQLLLQVSPDAEGYPVTPLDVRIKPVTNDEPLHVIAFREDPQGNLRQVTYKAKRVAGASFTCVLEETVVLNGCSGAPVVDKDGLLVGIVTGGTLMDLKNSSGYVRSFTGHAVSELLPVLKAAVVKKGIPESPAKVVIRPGKKERPTEDEEPVPASKFRA